MNSALVDYQMVEMDYPLDKRPNFSSQPSTGSEFNFSPDDPIPSLPYELVVEIFLLLPPSEIVRVCRLVSKTWKEFVDDPQFWQFGLRKCGKFTPKLMELPAKDIDWPRLYFYTAWRPNLVQSFDSKGKFSLTPWNIQYVDWERFSSRSENVFDRCDDSSWGGGDKWSIESGWIKPDEPSHEQVIKENEGCTKNYVTSYEWCCREQIVELSKYGYVNSIMDTIQPPISVSEWFSARWDCGSTFCIRVDLLNSENKVVAKYEDSITTDQWQGGELGWRKVEHVFKDYGSGVRFVRFADGGKDTQFWAGHYGSKMAGARMFISFK